MGLVRTSSSAAVAHQDVSDPEAPGKQFTCAETTAENSAASVLVRTPQGEAQADKSSGQEAQGTSPQSARRHVSPSLPSLLRCNSEQCRIIRARLMSQSTGRNQIYTLCSSMEREGRTTTCLGLAASFAEIPGRRVLVIEADPLTPQLERIFDLPPGLGFSDWLGGRCALDEATRQNPESKFMVMRAGEGDANRFAEHLASPSVSEKFGELRERFDHVIIDTPPVSRSAEAGLIGKLSDAVLLLVRVGHTPRVCIDRTLRVLDGFGARPIAAIVTGVSG